MPMVAMFLIRSASGPRRADQVVDLLAVGPGLHVTRRREHLHAHVRSEPGKAALRVRIPEGLGEGVGRAAKLLALRAAESGLELACRVAPEVPDRLVGDPARLRQVLVNLAGNAIKFTNEGEVVIDVTLAAEQPIAGGVRLQFAVRDTGIGISSEAQAGIFDAFNQADTSVTRRYGGTGLGLAISSQLVAMMDGEYGCAAAKVKARRFSSLENSPNPKCRRRFPRRWMNLPGLASSSSTTMPPIAISSRKRSVAGVCRRLWRTAPPRRWQRCVPRVGLTDYPAGTRRCDDAGGRWIHADRENQLRSRSAATNRHHCLVGVELGERKRAVDLGVAQFLVKPVMRSELLRAVLSALGRSEPGEVEEAQAESAPATALHILLAEDSVINQRVALGLLSKWGHHVEVVSDGQDAVSSLAERNYDLVLMDVHMPNMDGLEATAIVRNRESETGYHTPSSR